MTEIKLFTDNKFKLYSEILDFLEDVYSKRGVYQEGDANQEGKMDVLILNFTKVVNDCRAILLLSREGFYIQAGILTRSTSDSCDLMMHIAFEGENADVIDRWIDEKKVTHWEPSKRLNKFFKQQLDIKAHKKARKHLDDFVHANYNALKLYPPQSPGPTPMDDESFHKLTFWKGLINLYFTSCLLVVSLIVPELEERATIYIDKI
jgi:hypothetical protein